MQAQDGRDAWGRAQSVPGTRDKIASDDANGDVLVTELSAIFAGAMQGDGHGEGDGEGDDGQGQRGDDENEGNEPPAKKAKKVLKKPTSEIPGSDPPPAKAEKKPASATTSPKKPASATRSPLSMQRTARLARNARSVASPPTGREGLSQAAKANKPPKAAGQNCVRVGGGKTGSYCQMLINEKWTSVGNCTTASNASHRDVMMKLMTWVLAQASPPDIDACKAKCAELKTGVAKRPAAAAPKAGVAKRPAAAAEDENKEKAGVAKRPAAAAAEVEEDEDEEETAQEDEDDDVEDPLASPVPTRRAEQLQRRPSFPRDSDSNRDRFLRSDTVPDSWLGRAAPPG